MSDYRTLQEKYFPTLETYTLAITRAHGKHHPETFEIHDLFVKMYHKTEVDPQTEVSEVYQKIHQLTENYTIPEDACPTMKKTYEMLSELETAYLKE